MRVNLTVNGRSRTADHVWAGESLLYLLRERLGLPGSKNACEQGECGSCTIRLDGDLVCACLVAAGQAEGRAIITVEGLAPPRLPAGGRAGALGGSAGGRAGEAAAGGVADPDDTAGLAPLQRAFLDAGAVQCGFCTPGLLMAADELLERNPQPSDADIREALAGNLCRCTGYEAILDAVRLAASLPGRRHPQAPAPGTEGVVG